MSTLIWGTSQTYESNDSLENKVVRYEDNRVGVVCIINSSDYMKAALYSLSGNTLTLLDTSILAVDRWYNTETRNEVTPMNSDNFIVSYVDNTRSFGVSKIQRVGDIIYVISGAHIPWTIGPPSWPSVATIDTSTRKIITAWRDITNNRIRLRAGTFDTGFTVVTWGAIYNIPSSALPAYMKLAQLDTDKFILVYKRDSSPNRFVYARAGTVSGTTITLGTELQLSSVDNPRFVDCCSPDTDKFVAYWDENSVDGQCIVCTVSGTTITKGSVIQFTSNSIRAVCGAALDTKRIIIAYSDFTDGNKGKTVFGLVDWISRTISIESPNIFSNNSVAAAFDYGLGIAKINSDTLVVTYKDVTDGGKGKVIAGDFEFIPDPPTNVNAVAGNLQNTINWNSSYSATSYNLYYKKDKAPNNYFNNLDDFTEFKEIGTETSSIVSGAVRLDIPSGSSYSIAEIYKKLQGSGDFEATIDVLNYNPDDTTNGVRAHFRIITYASQPWPSNFFNIYFNQSGASQYSIDCTWRINGSDGNTGSSTIGTIPIKLRIKRIGTTLYGYYYTTSWNLFGSIDFGSYSSQLQSFTPFINDLNNNGGSVDFDNLIITPSVKDSGTKIVDVTSPHIHDSLDYDHVYCYEVTAENTTGESDASLEVNATPILPIPDPPTNVNVTPGKIKNTISWDSVLYATKYNLYHLKDKSPNQYFESIDDFTIYKKDGSESATIVSNKCRFDLPDSLDSEIGLRYWDYLISSGDHEIIINFSNYNPDDSDNGFQLHLRFRDNLGTALDFADIYYRTRDISPINLIRGIFRFNGSNNFTTSEFPSVLPTKLRIRRIGTILYVDYYSNETWTNHDSYDFGSRAVNLNTVWIFTEDLDPQYRGGSVDVDDLIIEPSVKNNGTKIADVTSPYIHSDLDNDHVYCYEITAENIKGESSASLEDYGIPEPDIPDIPILDIESGDSENIISIENIKDETEYDIYWSNTPGVTKDNSTKIENIQSPYNHIDLIRQNYYYRCLGRNIYGESELSEEICIKPDFEGKIWNHTERIKQDLLYQYKGD